MSVRFSSISHLRMEKSLSTATVLAKTVARPPLKAHRWLNFPGQIPQASSNVVFSLCESMAARRISSSW
ncbi:hypothetical protein H257_16557 [Aphanomyces astaci]|uniref:Uncharacterized protein n=1 Tax=Aphanomyces astaci TaxID=112090 RepID=W4FI32_APHAT|nr:hypothetical protein H257_16557 [Aphanomyces astaci]ETV67157.1 hypothetical protein H257_16557 [Aphanomyces astaci]|eukprot:XP_009843322.1 hypothetical protein H257_16557 [Aphanomyces astaci]